MGGGSRLKAKREKAQDFLLLFRYWQRIKLEKGECMNEKRAYQRVEVNLSGSFKAFGLSEDSFETTVLSLGLEGLCFYSSVQLKKNQGIELSIQLMNDRSVNVKGVTVWSDKKDESGFYRVGLKLVKTGSDDERAFVEFYLKKESEQKENKKKILIVDDEKDLVSLLSFHLLQAGYEIVSAFNGEEGYQKYQDEKPDLIILDLKMPKMNGFEVCRKIRREKKDIETPIVMLTALQDDADRLIGKVVGAQRYLTKPFKIEELLKEVEWLIPGDFK
jgi:CheY-like chemotaxis protein